MKTNPLWIKTTSQHPQIDPHVLLNLVKWILSLAWRHCHIKTILSNMLYPHNRRPETTQHSVPEVLVVIFHYVRGMCIPLRMIWPCICKGKPQTLVSNGLLTRQKTEGSTWNPKATYLKPKRVLPGTNGDRRKNIFYFFLRVYRHLQTEVFFQYPYIQLTALILKDVIVR